MHSAWKVTSQAALRTGAATLLQKINFSGFLASITLFEL
jgi:hypothetical protein